jgi:catechol 2,3-dioxygenase-like lactoylglutathione lyase family enzyme
MVRGTIGRVFDHVTIRVADRAASLRFYDSVLSAIGIGSTSDDDELPEWEDFSLAQADAEKPVTRNLHIGFAARSRDEVRAFWQAGVDAGHPSDGEPGPRPQYDPDYYGAFLLDPDGNSAEAAIHSATTRDNGNVDHLWIRVADLGAARGFYDAILPYTGFAKRKDEPDFVHYGAGGTSFSLLPGERPTEGLHLAFPAADDDTVRAFHAAALEAGYRDNGAPGERLVYHPGYYSAFVLAPDGTNVEVVNHHR